MRRIGLLNVGIGQVSLQGAWIPATSSRTQGEDRLIHEGYLICSDDAVFKTVDDKGLLLVSDDYLLTDSANEELQDSNGVYLLSNDKQ